MTRIESSTIWFAFFGTAALLVAPFIFSSGFAVTVLSQIGIAIIACLSYNILLGQGGMLSFGHAVYSGLGAYVAIHALNWSASGVLPIPVSCIPLVGGLAGLFFSALLGYVTTRKSGTPFAMITLGIAELVFAMSLMFSGFFGGEAGISGNRVFGTPILGISFASGIQVYYLIAAYTLVCVSLMYAFTKTPLGRMLNAVRDNPERVEFIGYNTQHVRYMGFMVAGFFAGISGGLASLNFEIVTAEVVGAARSGAYLLFTFLGGSTVFFGPIIGAILMVLAFVLLSEFTKAWLLYLGLVFVLMVMYAPGGIASLLMVNFRMIRLGKFRFLVLPYLKLFLAGGLAITGISALIEMIYHLQLNSGLGSELYFAGMRLDVVSSKDWLFVGLWSLLGSVILDWQRRNFVTQWNGLEHDIASSAHLKPGFK